MTNVSDIRKDRKTTISDYELKDMMSRADQLPGRDTGSGQGPRSALCS
jgi:hypothetical protein